MEIGIRIKVKTKYIGNEHRIINGDKPIIKISAILYKAIYETLSRVLIKENFQSSGLKWLIRYCSPLYKLLQPKNTVSSTRQIKLTT